VTTHDPVMRRGAQGGAGSGNEEAPLRGPLLQAVWRWMKVTCHPAFQRFPGNREFFREYARHLKTSGRFSTSNLLNF